MLKRVAALLIVLICIIGSAASERILYVNNPNPNDQLTCAGMQTWKAFRMENITTA